MKEIFFKEGQTAWWLVNNMVIEGKILHISDSSYPVTFRMVSGVTETFTLDGRFRVDDIAPSLFQIKPIITTNKPLTDEFQVGDKVECMVKGYGVVVEIYKKEPLYPVSVLFDGGSKHIYTIEGKHFNTDHKPTLRKV